MDLARSKVEKRLYQTDKAMHDVFIAFNVYTHFIHAELGSYKTKLNWLHKQMYQEPVATIETPNDTYHVSKSNPYASGDVEALSNGYAVHDDETGKTVYFDSYRQIFIIKNGKVIDTATNRHVNLNHTEQGKDHILKLYKEFC